MTRPHEMFGFTEPVGRRIARHSSLAWYALLWVALFGCVLTYVGLITVSSARGFQLRDAEERIERLRSQARALETDVARISSISDMSARADVMGFVAVDRIEVVNAAGHSYALVR
jgi:hypothetical protein